MLDQVAAADFSKCRPHLHNLTLMTEVLIGIKCEITCVYCGAVVATPEHITCFWLGHAIKPTTKELCGILEIKESLPKCACGHKHTRVYVPCNADAAAELLFKANVIVTEQLQEAICWRLGT